MLHFSRTDDYFSLDPAECRCFGRSLADRYQHASPFPHIVIDDFMDPQVLRSVLAGFPSSMDKAYFDRDQERLKFQYQPLEVECGLTRNLFAELNSQAFLSFLHEMTGIDGLVSDPYFDGGGLHETKRGGHLSVHADFNAHGKLKLERKINLLIYLNEEWKPEYGGQLELWDRDMKACAERIEPLFGRAVIFNTALDSFHGHPDPLSCPPNRSRRSIATYYYAAFDHAYAAAPKRDTNFQPRPGTDDKTDWEIRRRHFVNEWVPPRLQRWAHRLVG